MCLQYLESTAKPGIQAREFYSMERDNADKRLRSVSSAPGLGTAHMSVM